MDKPTPVYNVGDEVCIPNVPSAQQVRSANGSSWIYGKSSNHRVGSWDVIYKIVWAEHMKQWVYKIEMNGHMWNYLESDLLLGDGTYIDGQRSLFSV